MGKTRQYKSKTIISHLYMILDFIAIGRYARNEEAYVLGLRDFIRGLKIRKADSLNSYKVSYEKIKCPVCGQICYNKGDLDLHLKYNHPDVASTQPT